MTSFRLFSIQTTRAMFMEVSRGVDSYRDWVFSAVISTPMKRIGKTSPGNWL